MNKQLEEISHLLERDIKEGEIRVAERMALLEEGINVVICHCIPWPIPDACNWSMGYSKEEMKELATKLIAEKLFSGNEIFIPVDPNDRRDGFNIKAVNFQLEILSVVH
jgi:hypothetical protein